MLRVFISHNHANNREAVALKQWLAEQRPELANEIFLDIDPHTGLKLGGEWTDQLLLRTSLCEWLICLVSKGWIESRECQWEYLLADRSGKKIVIARLEDITAEDWQATGEAGDVTAKLQRCDLFADGDDTTVHVRAQTGVLEGDVRFNTSALHQIRRAIEGTGIGPENFVWPPADDSRRAPYRGWKPFEAMDAGVFFGRDAAITSGLAALRGMRTPSPERLSNPASMFVILGPSGSGKSSFLRAGLVPRLHRDDHTFMVTGVMRAGHALTGEQGFAAAVDRARQALRLPDHPLDDIEQACLDGDVDAILHLLVEIRSAAAKRLERVDDDASQNSTAPTLILPLDQAEELFPAAPDSEGARFLDLLYQLIERISGQDVGLVVAATIRTDRYEPMQLELAQRGVGAVLFNELKPMPAHEYKEVIAGPARRASDTEQTDETLAFDDDLVEQLIKDAAGSDTLPLLALTLDRLYQKYHRTKRFTLKQYRIIGGMRDVVNAEIDQILPADPDERDAALALLRSAFIPSLVRLNPENNQPLRRRAVEARLPAAARPLLDQLVDKRLLVRDRDERIGEVVIEVALESLFEHWDDLKTWLEEQRDELRMAEDVKHLAEGWRQSEHNPDWLLTRTRLEDAERLSTTAQFSGDLAGTLDFLAASRNVEDDRLAAEERQRQAELVTAREKAKAAEDLAVAESRAASEARKRSRILVAMLAVVAVVALVAGYLFVVAKRAEQATLAQLKTSTALRLVAEGQAMIDDDLPGGEVRGIQQVLAGHALDARAAAIAVPDVFMNQRGVVRILQGSPQGGATQGVRSVAITSDGRRIAVGSDGPTVRVWDAETGAVLELGTGPKGPTWGVAFSPDGTMIATASGQGRVQLWNSHDGQPVGAPIEHGSAVHTVAFSADGQRIATGTEDGAVRIFDVTGREGPKLAGHPGKIVRSVAFDPRRPVLASGGDDGVVRLWDADDGRQLAATPPEKRVVSVAFSDDGRRIAAGRVDGEILILDAANLFEQRRFSAHPKIIDSVAFRTGTDQLVSGSVDNTVRVWDADTGTPVGEPLTGHQGEVTGVAVSADGTRIFSGSADGSVREWDATLALPIPAAQGLIHGLAFSHDGKTFASAGDDGTVRLWDARTATPRGRPLGSPVPNGESAIRSVAFSPDDRRIAVASRAGSVVVWDVSTGRSTPLPMEVPDERRPSGFNDPGSAEIVGDADTVQSVAFSPDGSRLVAGGNDGILRSWDMASLRSIRAVSVGYPIWSVAYRAEEPRIATGSGGKVNTIQLWDDDLEPRLAPMVGPEGLVIYGVSFSPDGRHLVKGSPEGTLLVWDIGERSEPVSMGNDMNAFVSVHYSHGGQWIVAGGNDNAVRLWDTEHYQPIGQPFKGHTSSILSVVFAPGDDRMLSGGRDGDLRLWPTPSEPVRSLCDKIGNANMTPEQWRDWVSPDLDYVAPCPGAS